MENLNFNEQVGIEKLRSATDLYCSILDFLSSEAAANMSISADSGIFKVQRVCEELLLEVLSPESVSTDATKAEEACGIIVNVPADASTYPVVHFVSPDTGLPACKALSQIGSFSTADRSKVTCGYCYVILNTPVSMKPDRWQHFVNDGGKKTNVTRER